MNNITIKTAKGDTITTASSEDTAEQDNINKILKDPNIDDNEGFDEDKLKAGMNKEIESMKKHQVFTEVHLNDIPLEDRKNLIQSRWVHREKRTEVAAELWLKASTRSSMTWTTSTPLHPFSAFYVFCLHWH